MTYQQAQVRQIVDLFGGIRPMARILHHKNHTTVQGWYSAQSIPSWRGHEIEEAAKSQGLPVSLREGGLVIQDGPKNPGKDAA